MSARLRECLGMVDDAVEPLHDLLNGGHVPDEREVRQAAIGLQLAAAALLGSLTLKEESHAEMRMRGDGEAECVKTLEERHLW